MAWARRPRRDTPSGHRGPGGPCLTCSPRTTGLRSRAAGRQSTLGGGAGAHLAPRPPVVTADRHRDVHRSA
jgi:hypothetical protein